MKLREKENIIIELRSCGLTKTPALFLAVIILILAFFFMFWFFRQGWWGQILLALIILFSLFLFFRTYFFWKKNVLIITNQRIIDHDQRGLFHQVSSELTFEQIEDVAVHSKGIFASIFKYGDLVIQNAGGKIHLVALKIKDPHDIQSKINELRNKSSMSVDEVIKHLSEFNREELEEIGQNINKILVKYD